MTIETVALLKLPKAVFDALPRADDAPSDPSRARLRSVSGAAYEARLLDNAILVYAPVDFGAEPEAVIDQLWDLVGDALADHDDDRGIFVIPSVAKIGSGSYDGVLKEIGEVGEWIALDEDEDDEGDDDDLAAHGEVVPSGAGGDDFMSMIASITNSLGADTLMGLQNAMMSGDAKAFERAQEAVAAKLSTRADLVGQLQGLMGAMPPELRDMAMNASPEDIMQQMKGATTPEQLEAMRKQIEGDKGRKR